EGNRAGRAIHGVCKRVGAYLRKVLDLAPDSIGVPMKLARERDLVNLTRARFYRDNQVQFVFCWSHNGWPSDANCLPRQAGPLADQLAFHKFTVICARLCLVLAGWNDHCSRDDKYWWLCPSLLPRYRDTRTAWNFDGLVGDLGKLELQHHPCRLRRKQVHAQQVEKFDLELVGNSVQPIDHRFRQEGKHLNQRHPGIADRQISPAWTRRGDAVARLLDQLRKCAIVQIGRGNRHQLRSPFKSNG